jgi:NodT family efflux transporter outer membrane factor (OMF) lipoprotein
VLAALATGCVDVPEYQRPDVPVPTEWSSTEFSADIDIEPEWWRGFGDPFLNELIASAIEGSPDLDILSARTGVARAQTKAAQGALLPKVEAGTSTTTLKTSDTDASTVYRVGSEVTWEADLWGKTRKGIEAQEAAYQASEADWRAGYLVLVADVANAYFQIRQLDEVLNDQRQAIERNTRMLETFESLVSRGLRPASQATRQRAEVANLQAVLERIQGARELSENALAALLGEIPGEFSVPPTLAWGDLSPIAVPAGLPADLLRRRPDIIAAEFRLLARVNLVGQARLAQMPSLGLTGGAGTAAFDLTDLGKLATFNLASFLSFPVFDSAVRARIKVSEAEVEVAEAEYRAAVLVALRDVEDSLTRLSTARREQPPLHTRREELASAMAAKERMVELGLMTVSDTLIAERDMLDAERRVRQNHWQALTDTVRLYKAMGGSWPTVVVGDEVTRR